MINFFEYFKILSILVSFPIFGILFILPIRKVKDFQKIKNIENVSILISFMHLLIFLIIFFSFNHENFANQFTEHIPFIPFHNINYNIGVNKLSLFFILISILFISIAGIISFSQKNINLKNSLILMFLIQSGIIGVFVSINIILFYIFFEIAYLFFIILISQNVYTQDKLIKTKIFKEYFLSSFFFMLFILYLINKYDSTTIEIINYKILNSRESFFINLWITIFFFFRSGVFWFFNLTRLVFSQDESFIKIIFSIISTLPIYGVTQFFKYNKSILQKAIVAVLFFSINFFSIRNLKKNINSNKFFENKNLEEIIKFLIIFLLVNIFLSDEIFQMNLVMLILNQFFSIFFLIILFDNQIYGKLFFKKKFMKLITFYIFISLIFSPFFFYFKKIYLISFESITQNNFIQFLFNYFSSIYIFIYVTKIFNKKNFLNREKIFIKNSFEKNNNFLLNFFLLSLLFFIFFFGFFLNVFGFFSSLI